MVTLKFLWNWATIDFHHSLDLSTLGISYEGDGIGRCLRCSLSFPWCVCKIPSPWCVCSPFLPVGNHILLWIHSPADGNTFWLGWISCCGTQVETLCGQVFSVLLGLGVYLGVELPGGKVKSCVCLCEESVVSVQSVCKAFTTGAGRTGTVYCFGEDRCSSGWPWRWPDLEFLLLLLDAKITDLYPGALSLKKKKVIYLFN